MNWQAVEYVCVACVLGLLRCVNYAGGMCDLCVYCITPSVFIDLQHHLCSHACWNRDDICDWFELSSKRKSRNLYSIVALSQQH